MAGWRCSPRSFGARRAPLLALALAACGGQSSREERSETGGDAGTPSAGGAAGTNTGGIHSGGTAGTNTGGIDTGGAGGVCDSLNLGYLEALARAKTCDWINNPYCDRLYRSELPCGCPTFANESSELEAYERAWAENGCPQPPCALCDPVTGSSCSEYGRCEEVTQPQCNGASMPPSPVCDYGLPCTDAQNCLHGDCYVPGTRENPVCSKRCNATSECPIGSACVEVGGDGSHCFISCTSDAFCRSINAAPENPLACVGTGGETICIQESEP